MTMKNKLVLVALLSAPLFGFNFSDLESRIEEKKTSSIEALLPHLPEEFRENAILVTDSRSSQKASFRDPRAILFSSDAKMIMAFNGHPSQEGHNKLEVIEFDDRSGSFQFREIEFHPGKAPTINRSPTT